MTGVRSCLYVSQSARVLILINLLDTWGFSDVQAAVAAIPDWMGAVSWDGPAASLNDWVILGHSNGGMKKKKKQKKNH